MPDKNNIACDFAIFGVLGDLSRRKLLPSLYELEKAGHIHKDTRILGIARHELSQEDFVAKMTEALNTFSKDTLIPEIKDRLLARLHYILINIDRPDDYKKLAEFSTDETQILINCFSVAPFLFDDICK